MMSIRTLPHVTVDEIKTNCVSIDGFDEALFGEVKTDQGWRALYSMQRMVGVLVERDGMTFEEALEYIDYNVLRALPYYPPSPYVIDDITFEHLHLVNRSKQE